MKLRTDAGTFSNSKETASAPSMSAVSASVS